MLIMVIIGIQRWWVSTSTPHVLFWASSTWWWVLGEVVQYSSSIAGEYAAGSSPSAVGGGKGIRQRRLRKRKRR